MIERARISYALCCFACFLLSAGCATSQPPTRGEAIRIADAKAQQEMKTDLRIYEHWPVWHDEGRWYIGYRQRGKRWVDFGVDVYDDTKRAAVLIAN